MHLPRRFLPHLWLLLGILAAPALAQDAASGPTTRPVEVQVEFLSLDQARKAIIDESVEPYFKLLQPMEMSVKTGSPITGDTLAQQRDECRKRYQNAVQEFTDEEKDALRWYVSKLDPLVSGQYPLYASTPWSFIKLSAEFEGGMPHTRGGNIVLSEQVLAPMVQMQKLGPDWQTLLQFGALLLHEQSHVVQREHPAAYAKLYSDYWGFVHARSVQGCEWLTHHQLVNPDGVDVRWVFPIKNGDQTQWIWPLVIFGDVKDLRHASFASMRMVAIDLEPLEEGSFRAKVDDEGKPVMRELTEVAQYVKLFPGTDQIYHPNEGAADLFAHVVVAYKILPGKAPPEAQKPLEEAQRVLAPLRDWFEKILNPKPT